MCGISGIYDFNDTAQKYTANLEKAASLLSKRGPDKQATYTNGSVGFAHARLSIIDVSDSGSQPMSDTSGRYTIVFNGEIYNFQLLKEQYLSSFSIHFRSGSDTEVLLYLFIHHGEKMLEWLDGFFGFAIYDALKDELFIARDRIGIKPLLYAQDKSRFVFASEMKALLCYPIKRDIDEVSLYEYLMLNYIPAPHSIFKGVKKLLPGHYAVVNKSGFEVKQYFQINPSFRQGQSPYLSFEEGKKKLYDLMEKGVTDRLIADVPLGAFLSGGIDSSIIVALASKHTPHLSTFSIGYKDEPFFDETSYAELVAKKFNTNHTTFSLTNDDLYQHLFDILDYIDEPFADSSAIAVYILSKHTRSKVKVALSGDGADELFAGYNKHLAEFRARQKSIPNLLLKHANPLFAFMPQSRNSKAGNLMRQLDRYSEGLNMGKAERYWRWCSFCNEKDAASLLKESVSESLYGDRKSETLRHITSDDMNEVLYTDMHLVLQNDMLTKVDLMSMANGLEVRVPFLAHRFVDYVFSLPFEYKLHQGVRKHILKEAFRHELPAELFNRPKHGFEVPLLKWFRKELRSLIFDDLLAPSFIEAQGIFSVEGVNALKQQLDSASPGDAQARIWGLIVFQNWWKKYCA